MALMVLRNATVLDVVAGELLEGRHVVIEDGRIREVADRPVSLADAAALDVAGRTVMPGLCDAHVHVIQSSADIPAMLEWAPSYQTARAQYVLDDMIRRGFTTVRDAGGADYGLADAIEERFIEGPRLLFSGNPLSQTGGHGDQRRRGDNSVQICGCLVRHSHIVDGADQVRRAARDELRKGAHQIKIMVSGGVDSPTDHILNTQFSREEMRAAVEEAEAARTYVLAHAYSARAINRALECGVRSIEHGNLLDDTSIDLLLAKDAFLVPTLAVYEALHREGEAAGFPAVSQAKVAHVRDAGLSALEKAHRGGVRIVFGTDLLGDMHAMQMLEFDLRAEVQAPIDIIRAATVTAAELFNMSGEIGVVAPGARADLLVIDGNPLDDLGLFQPDGRHLSLVMKDGRRVVDRLS